MRLNFTKMHGLGNDYIYFNCLENDIENPSGLSKILSDRHFSIGGDGIVLICPSDAADAKMRMFNADGSEGKMCGNAIRCVGKYLYDNKIVLKEQISIETLSGIKYLDLTVSDSRMTLAEVNMGKAILDPSEIPVLIDKNPVVNHPVVINDETYHITCVSMGNPHCIIYRDDIDSLEIEKTGPLFENNPLFPDRVNTEFVKVIRKNELSMRVWERGSGETMACGTGACACAVASVLNGFCDKDTDITVHLRGGDLIIKYTDDAVYMTGPAAVAFEGIVEV